MSWKVGGDHIRAALNNGDLQQVAGAQAAGEGWIGDARKRFAAAQAVAETDANSAYVTVYDAARFALVGLLAQQGLRATQKGGHYAVEQAVRAQFGSGFVAFGALRRRRAELEYPTYPGEMVERDELLDAFTQAQQIIDHADQLLEHLPLFAAP